MIEVRKLIPVKAGFGEKERTIYVPADPFSSELEKVRDRIKRSLNKYFVVGMKDNGTLFKDTVKRVEHTLWNRHFGFGGNNIRTDNILSNRFKGRVLREMRDQHNIKVYLR